MNIIEAVKSGKKFRRKGQTEWLSMRFKYFPGVFMMEQDILADDWEVEEKKVEITYAKLHAAYCAATPGYVQYSGPKPVFVYPDFEKIAKELGLD